jgi:hypothetical protein
MEHSKYLERKELKLIKKWIKKVKKHKYQSKFKCDTKPKKKMRLRYKVMGCGCNRIVYDIGNGAVLKVAITVRGIENNKREAKIYKSVPSKFKSHMAQVKESGNGWIIMEKIKKRTPVTMANKQRVLKLRRLFLQKGIRTNDLFFRSGKTHWSNIRIKDQKIIIIDYGEFLKN